jgi:hypothetical protein
LLYDRRRASVVEVASNHAYEISAVCVRMHTGVSFWGNMILNSRMQALLPGSTRYNIVTL